MNIILSNLLPFPIIELDYYESNIWAAEKVIFENEKSYLVKAFSGKGKTTLLSAIYGIRKDYSGEIFIDNKNIKRFSFNDLAELRKNAISYVFQGLDLFDELTVIENIKIKNNLTDFRSENEIDTFLQKLDIQTLKHRKIKTLSFGQKQRVAIVRALCQPFKWILLDEPFSHLDNDNIQKAFNLISVESQKNKAGIILTSLSNDYQITFDVNYKI